MTTFGQLAILLIITSVLIFTTLTPRSRPLMRPIPAICVFIISVGAVSLSSCCRQNNNTLYPEAKAIRKAVEAATVRPDDCKVMDWGKPQTEDDGKFAVDIVVKSMNKYGNFQLQKLHIERRQGKVVGDHWVSHDIYWEVTSQDRDPIDPELVKVKE